MNSASGGGGERVLWVTVAHILEKHPFNIVIYTGESDTPHDILEKVKRQFNIAIASDRVKIIYFTRLHWLESKK